MNCTRCGVETKNPKFCSRSCSNGYHNSVRPKRTRRVGLEPWLPKGQSRPCGLPSCSGSASGMARFCSQSCAATAKRLEKVRRWLEGDASEVTCDRGLVAWARRWLLDGAECAREVCGWSERHPVDGLPLVQVDHCDGDAMNNSRENLRVLCPNHHAMTPHYGARNKNGTRAKRRGS